MISCDYVCPCGSLNSLPTLPMPPNLSSLTCARVAPTPHDQYSYSRLRDSPLSVSMYAGQYPYE